MMIFKETWQQVLDGTKTQTRRPAKIDEALCYAISPKSGSMLCFVQGDGFTIPTVAVLRRGNQAKGWRNVRIKWQVGKTYAVQPGRGKKAVGRVRITKIRRERLQEISAYDIEAEGVRAPLGDLFFSDIEAPYNYPTQWRKHFRNLWDSLYRKAYRWEDNPEVWVLEFERSE